MQVPELSEKYREELQVEQVEGEVQVWQPGKIKEHCEQVDERLST
jgi:hypothetical protein